MGVGRPGITYVHKMCRQHWHLSKAFSTLMYTGVRSEPFYFGKMRRTCHKGRALDEGSNVEQEKEKKAAAGGRGYLRARPH